MGLCDWEPNPLFVVEEPRTLRHQEPFLSSWHDSPTEPETEPQASELLVGPVWHLGYETWKLSKFSSSSSWCHKYFEFFFFS